MTKHTDIPIRILPHISHKQKKTHKRTSSDLDRSLRSEEKWKEYEKQTAKHVPSNTEKVPESKCPLASLSLEQWGGTLSTNHITVLQEVMSSSVTAEFC